MLDIFVKKRKYALKNEYCFSYVQRSYCNSGSAVVWGGGREGECSNDTLNKWRKGAGGKQFVLRRLLLVVVGQQGEIVLHP